MIITVKNSAPFQILTSAMVIGPSQTGYQLEVAADGRNFSPLFSVGPNVTRQATNLSSGAYYRLNGNVGEVKVNWNRSCVTEGGAAGNELTPVTEFPLNADPGTVVAYSGSSSAAGIYMYDGTDWVFAGGSTDLSGYWNSGETKDYVDEAISGISLEGYATSGDMQSAFTLISETQQVAAAGLNQLEGRIDELSGNTPDISAYWTSAETKNYVDDKVVSAETQVAQSFANLDANVIQPMQGDIRELSGITEEIHDNFSAYTPTTNFATINGSAITNGGNIVISGPDVSNYVTSAQVETQIVEKNYVTSAQVETQMVAKNYITSADTANFVTSAQVETQIVEKNYVTSAQVETQIEAKNYVNSGDVKSQVEAYNYATVSQIPTVPTSNTAFTNDAGYITDAAIENLVTSAQVETQIDTKAAAYTPTSGFSTINGSAITNGGNIVIQAGGGDMSNYWNSAETKTYVDSAATNLQNQIDTVDEVVSQALVDLNNRVDEISASTPDLSPYWTSAQTNTAISAATQDMVTSTDVRNMVKLSQAAYDQLSVKDPETFYIIVNE